MVRSRGCAAGLLGIFFDRVAHAEPGGDELAALRPSEDPWNGAQAGEAGLSATAGGAGADLGVFELGDRRRHLEIVKDFGIVDDVGAIEIEGGG